MERAANWHKADITRTPDGGVTIALHVTRWSWRGRRDTVIHVTIPKDDAAVMHAQMSRILDDGQTLGQFDGQGLHPHYRGAVN